MRRLQLLIDRKGQFAGLERRAGPMHPEYPCAHCTLRGTVAGIVEAALGTADIPEIAAASPTAPRCKPQVEQHETKEVANARVWAGFHYRSSTRVGTKMGLEIGEYVVKNAMLPIVTSSR